MIKSEKKRIKCSIFGRERVSEAIGQNLQVLPFITEGKHAEADYKTRLQEIVQQNPEEKLSYVVEQETGPDHNKHFVVAVRFNSDCVARGEGRSKKMAEQHAAREALKLLGVIKEK